RTPAPPAPLPPSPPRTPAPPPPPPVPPTQRRSSRGPGRWSAPGAAARTGQAPGPPSSRTSLRSLPLRGYEGRRGERVGADSAASGAGPGGIWADRKQGAFLGSEAPAAVGGPLAMSRHRAGCGYAAARPGGPQPSGAPGDGDRPRAVQPGMGLAVVAVEPHELFVKHGVQAGGPRVRPVARADGDPAGDLIEGELAEGHRREHARAPGVRVHRVGDLLDGPAEHVGEDLAPRAGPGAAADEPDRLHPRPGEPPPPRPPPPR